MYREDYLNSFLRSVANKQREVELIVSDDGGSSDITLPKQPKTHNSTLIDREDKQNYAASLLITEALREAKVSRHILEVKIHHDSKMAQLRLVKGNNRGACLSMRRVVSAQFEYVHILQRINALVVLHHSLETGLVEGRKQAASFLNEILLVPQGDKPTELDTYELLDQLEHGDFFPLLDAETGAISFTSSYEHAASTLQVDCDALRPANQHPDQL